MTLPRSVPGKVVLLPLTPIFYVEALGNGLTCRISFVVHWRLHCSPSSDSSRCSGYPSQRLRGDASASRGVMTPAVEGRKELDPHLCSFFIFSSFLLSFNFARNGFSAQKCVFFSKLDVWLFYHSNLQLYPKLPQGLHSNVL